MILEQSALVAEIVAAIGILVSLIFVGLEIRQNTKQLRETHVDGFMDQFAEIRRQIYQNKDLSEIMQIGRVEPERLDHNQKTRFASIMDDFFALGMQIHRKSVRGVLPMEAWTTVEPWYATLVNSAGGELYWTTLTTSVFEKDFKEAMERLRAQQAGPTN